MRVKVRATVVSPDIRDFPRLSVCRMPGTVASQARGAPVCHSNPSTPLGLVPPIGAGQQVDCGAAAVVGSGARVSLQPEQKPQCFLH